MTLSSKLGTSFDQVKDQVKIKSIPMEIGQAKFTLKVRIPLKKEMEEIIESISNPPAERIEAVYNRFSKPILDTLQDGGDELQDTVKQVITVLDNDIIVDGNSVRNVSRFSAMWEIKVEKFFSLLQSETDTPVNETYQQIVDEFPEQVIRQIVEEVEAAVKPDYKTSKKN